MLIAKGRLNRASTPLALWLLSFVSVTILARVQVLSAAPVAVFWAYLYLIPICIASGSFSLRAGLVTAALGTLSLAPSLYPLLVNPQVSPSSVLLLSAIALFYVCAVLVGETSILVRRPYEPARARERAAGMPREIQRLERPPYATDAEHSRTRLIEQLSKGYDVAKRLNAARSLDEVYQVALTNAMEATGARRGAVIRLGHGGGNAPGPLAVYGDWGGRQDADSGLSPACEKMVEKVVRTKQPVLHMHPNGDAAERGAFSPSTESAHLAIPIFCPGSLPMERARVSDADVMGAILLELAWNERANEAEGGDRAFLELLAEQSAIAIERASFYDSVSKEKHRTEQILGSVADGLYVTDSNRRILALNPAMERIVGMTNEEAMGKFCCDVLRPGAEPQPSCPLSRAISTSSPVQCRPLDCKVMAGPSRGASISRSVAPILNEEGETVGTVSVLRDVSKEEKLSQQKTEFVSLVSHEIRSPLTNIKAGVELLLTSRVPRPLQQEILQIISTENVRLMDFVERVLDASALEAGKMVFDKKPLSLLPLIRSKVAFFASRSNLHSFRVEAPADLPLALGDDNKMGAIINNLLENAIKYSLDGGNITIEVGKSSEEGFLSVSVSDEGVGIPVDCREEVFERFVRLNTEGVQKANGHGLGLYIARALVEGQSGRIWVADTAGKGTKITFTIPQLMEEVDNEVER